MCTGQVLRTMKGTQLSQAVQNSQVQRVHYLYFSSNELRSNLTGRDCYLPQFTDKNTPSLRGQVTSQHSRSHSDPRPFVASSFIALLLNPRGLESGEINKHSWPCPQPFWFHWSEQGRGHPDVSHGQPCNPSHHLPELCSTNGREPRGQAILK